MTEQTSPAVIGAASPKQRAVTGCLYLFALPFVGFGLFALMGAIQGLLAGNLTTAAYAGMFAVIFGGIGFGLVYVFRRGA